MYNITSSHYQHFSGAGAPALQAVPPADTSSTGSSILDWIPSTSAVGIVEQLAKATFSDVARVGDLLINGRDNAIVAERPVRSE